MASATLSDKSDDFNSIYGISLFQNENSLCVLCDLGPKFQMLLRMAFFRGLNVLKSLYHVITIGFVEVDRVMCYGETKSVFGNK
jgi:hypothetical protein